MLNRLPALCALFAALFAMAPMAAQADRFYAAPAAEIAGQPGSIIRAETFAAPPGASAAYRIVYRSTDAGGRPIAVSGVVIVPSAPAPPGGRRIVSWGHATSGIAPNCARSMYGSLYSNMYGLQDMLARGYVVAATDYPGLGVSGVHAYLIGASQGHAMLDAARAARALPEAQAGDVFIPAGYSQGAHAALFAGNLAASYAPELTLAGIAAAAPPTDLAELMREGGGDPIGRVFATFALMSWSKLYGLPLDGVLAPAVGKVAANIASECNLEAGSAFKIMFAEQAFEREGFLKKDLTHLPRWKALMAKNSPAPTPQGVPVFIAQGTNDHLVRPAVTQVYAAKLCSRGTRLTFVPVRGGHENVGRLSAAPMVEWMSDRFAGRRAPDDCGSVS